MPCSSTSLLDVLHYCEFDIYNITFYLFVLFLSQKLVTCNTKCHRDAFTAKTEPNIVSMHEFYFIIHRKGLN